LAQLALVCWIFNFSSNGSDLELTAPFLRTAAAGVINDEPPHYPRGIAHESRAIWKSSAILPSHLDISFVQKSRRADVYPKTLSCQLPFG